MMHFTTRVPLRLAPPKNELEDRGKSCFASQRSTDHLRSMNAGPFSGNVMQLLGTLAFATMAVVNGGCRPGGERPVPTDPRTPLIYTPG